MGDRAINYPAAAAPTPSDGAGQHRQAGVPYPRMSLADRRFLEELEQAPLIGSCSPAEERARMQAAQAARITDYPVRVQEFQTPACPVHLIRPHAAPASPPILFFLHGGGWVLGDLQTHTRLVCELALRTNSVVAFIDYPRAPEHPFPAPLEACISALYAVLDTAESLQLDAGRFAIAGDSSGGNLAAALILSAIERKLRLPVRQVLLYPVTNYDWTTPSYKEFSANANLSHATMQWFWANYLPQPAIGHEPALGSVPQVSPLRAADEALAQFPPSLIVTCEYDVLRDEGEQFAGRLIQCGVDVAAVRWLGSLHGFLVTDALADSASAHACIDLVAQYVRRGFGTA